MVSPTPVHIQTSTPNQYPSKKTSSASSPFWSATTSTSKQGALFPPSSSQLKKSTLLKRHRHLEPYKSPWMTSMTQLLGTLVWREPNYPPWHNNVPKKQYWVKRLWSSALPFGSRSLPGLRTAELNNLKEILFRQPTTPRQPLSQKSNCCRSRKCIQWHIPVHAIFFYIFYLFFLLVLSRPSKTYRTPNKDQKTEKLFYFLLVQVP